MILLKLDFSGLYIYNMVTNRENDSEDTNYGYDLV